MAEFSAEGTGFQANGQSQGGTVDRHQPLRLWRFAEAPSGLQALSDAGGGEVLLAVVPAAWMEEAWLNGLPYALSVLLDPLDAPHLQGPAEQELWGRVQRAAQPDGSCVVIVARP